MNKKELLATIVFLLVLGFSYLFLGTPLEEAINEAKEVTGEVMGEQTSNDATYEVFKIVDGDTIKIFYEGNIESVRLIGIDTPEEKECFYTQATKKLSAFLKDKKVRIEFDQSQGERDKYGRLLLYIWLDDTLVNEEMVKDGYAHEYTYNAPYKYQDDFKLSQKEAQLFRRGLWGDECSQ